MAATSNATVAEPAERVLVIERVFDAPRELVFKYWTEPGHLSQWLGPKGFSSTIVTWDCVKAEDIACTSAGPTVRIIGNKESFSKSLRRNGLCGRIAGRTPRDGRRAPRPC